VRLAQRLPREASRARTPGTERIAGEEALEKKPEGAHKRSGPPRARPHVSAAIASLELGLEPAVAMMATKSACLRNPFHMKQTSHIPHPG
jgi:hypothetical protein